MIRFAFLFLIATLTSPCLFSQKTHIFEDFNSTTIPASWTNTAISGTPVWSVGMDASTTNQGNNNLDGTPLVFFDDDNLGASNTNNTVALTTPAFNNANDSITFLEFDYNFREFAAPTDSFKVEVFDGIHWNLVYFKSSDDCGNWVQPACIGNYPHANINISAYANTNCQVRFTYHDGNDWCWYVGIDNVSIYSPFENDIGVSKIISPTSTTIPASSATSACALSRTEIITVQVNNYATKAVNAPFGITIQANNATQVINEIVSVGIPANDSIIYSFTTTLNLSAVTTHSIVVFTNYSLDSNNLNDGVLGTIQNSGAEQLPYHEDFENQHNWNIGGVNSSWQRGIPSGTIVKNRYNNDRSLVTNVSGLYNDNENSFIESPCIFLRSSATPILSFDMIYQIETNFDSLVFEYSTNGGYSWQNAPRDSVSSNWPDTNSFWTGSSNGWMHLENRFPQLSNKGSVKFRFRLITDAGTKLQGVAIDNFTIKYNDSVDIKLVEILAPSASGICSNGNENIYVKLKNKGLTAIDSCTISYRVNSGAIFTDTLHQLILPEQELNYVFKTSFNFFNGLNNSVNVWVNTVNDTFNINDTISEYLVDVSNFNLSSTRYSTPFFEDFNGWPLGGLGADWQLERPSTNAVDWGRQYSISCPIRNPSNGLFGVYLGFRFGPNTSYLPSSIVSPCISLDRNKNSTLEFYYFGLNSSNFNLLVEVYDGKSWNIIDTIKPNPQTINCNSRSSRYQKDLSEFRGRTIKIKLTHEFTQPYTNHGFAVDNFHVFEKHQTDIKLLQFENVTSGCNPNDTISVMIENYGDSTLSNIPMAYQVNGGAIITDTVSTSLNSLDSLIFSFSPTFSFSTPNTSYTIRAWSDVLGDQNTSNDTLEILIRNTTQFSNYFEDFESFTDISCQSNVISDSLRGWRRPENSSSWQVHDVSLCGTGTITTGTGPSFDHTNGNGTFMHIASNVPPNNPHLITPCLDFSQDSLVELSFWYHKYGPGGMGDLFIDVFANGVWNLGIDSIIGQTQVFATSPWLQKVIGLNQFAGEVFEIRFRSSLMGRFSDMAIDDVHIYNPLTVGIRNKTPVNATFTLYPNPNNGNFNLNVSNELVGKHYQVFDLKGSLVIQGRINTTNSPLELSNAEKGVYFMRIEGLAKAERIVVL